MIQKQPATAKKKANEKHDDPTQSERFITAAREAEADETEEGAQRAFRQVARPDKGKGPKRG